MGGGRRHDMGDNTHTIFLPVPIPWVSVLYFSSAFIFWIIDGLNEDELSGNTVNLFINAQETLFLLILFKLSSCYLCIDKCTVKGL